MVDFVVHKMAYFSCFVFLKFMKSFLGVFDHDAFSWRELNCEYFWTDSTELANYVKLKIIRNDAFKRKKKLIYRYKHCFSVDFLDFSFFSLFYAYSEFKSIHCSTSLWTKREPIWHERRLQRKKENHFVCVISSTYIINWIILFIE